MAKGDIDDPRDAIHAAARYLDANGTGDQALYAYNHSYAYVRAVKRFAARMKRDERAFRTYYAWQVYVRTPPAARGGSRGRSGNLQAATRATYTAFAVNGFAFASWASRIPAVKDRLELSPRELGLVLIAIAIGSVIALPSSGPIVHRFGTQRVVAAMAVIGGAGLVLAAVGHLAGVVPLVIGLFVWGLSTAVWDVAMNIQGALVEQHLKRSIMSRFHAGLEHRHGRGRAARHRDGRRSACRSRST